MADGALNKAQKEAVEYTDGPLLIVAGAGTGKTRVITHKIAHLVREKLATPEQILAVTFTEKAALEMQTRVDAMINIPYVDLQISTFHGFCQRVLETYGLDVGLPNRFNIVTPTDAWLLIRSHIYDFALDYYRPLGNPNRFIHELIKHFGKCKDELVSAKDYLQYVEALHLNSDAVGEIKTKDNLKEIAEAYHIYNQLLLDNESIDFGDLIFYTVKLFRERPHILKKMHERFRFILVDEFQDVNYAQYELIKLLSQKGHLTVVGDDDQSIYAFRGASVSNILHFKTDFKDARAIVLTENYRSHQNILDAAYRLLQENNPDRLEPKLGIDKKLLSMTTSAKDQEPHLVHIHTSTLEDEVKTVVEAIINLKEKKAIACDDIAILVRANNHAEPFFQALEAHGIPYEFLTSGGLHRQSIVIDCFSFFKVIDNYHESPCIYRLLRLPSYGFRDDDMQKFTSEAKKKSISYYEALQRGREFRMTEDGMKVCERVRTLIEEGMRRAREEKPTAVILAFLEESGYLDYLMKKIDERDTRAVRSVRYLEQFFELLEKYQETTPGAHVASFVEYYDQLLASGDDGKLYQPSDTEDSVNMMTVHAAKGLEFRFVFVVNCVEQRFPTRRRGEGIEFPLALVKDELPEGDYHYQEERRLFYVAMTRAKEGLSLTSADYYGSPQKKKISRFIQEIGIEKMAVLPSAERKVAKKTSRVPSPHIYAIPKTFSFSQIRSFLVCPYQYKMVYLLNVPMKGSPQFSFGSSIHSTLQKFYQRIQEINSLKQHSLFGLPLDDAVKSNIRVPSLDEFLMIYDTSWISDWYHDKRQREAYYKKGKKMLETFYTAQEERWTVPVLIEGGFRIRIGDDTVTGRIDRVDRLDTETLHIIDYKTGQSKEDVKGDDKDQLLLYQLAITQLPKYKAIGPPSKLTYYYLDNNTQASFLGTDEELCGLQEKIRKTIETIHTTDFSSITRAEACGRCDFCQITEFRT